MKERLKIEIVDLNKLKPYVRNAKKHTSKQIEQIKQSIQQFGFNDPIAIDEDNMIIEGHGRYEALKQLGYTEVECIRLSDLTKDQKKAYMLIHNKLTMNTGFDLDILNDELLSLFDVSEFDMEDFDFITYKYEEVEVDYKNPREKTDEAYNLDIANELKEKVILDTKQASTISKENDFWQMPIIQNDNHIPKDLVGFNYLGNYKEDRKSVGIHFFLDDYQFERIWNNPENYIEQLQEYDCMLSPDFSLYLDMPTPMKIWNVHRSRLIGQYYQSHNIKVIPTISWGEQTTFRYCFEGISKGSIVCISTIGVKKDNGAFKIWKDGVDELIRRIEPSVILIYGGEVEYNYGNIKTFYFENHVTADWNNRNKKGRMTKKTATKGRKKATRR